MKAVAVALALVACGGDDPAPMGMANMSFGVSNSVRNSGSLVDPLMGTIYGQIFLAEEVGLGGPIEGAMTFGNIEVAGVDLTTAQEAGAFTSPALAPQSYTVLGFFDVDGNGAADRSPDNGDPVTLPTINQFTIEGEDPVSLVVSFDLVYNF